MGQARPNKHRAQWSHRQSPEQMKRKREIVYFLQYNQYTVSPIDWFGVSTLLLTRVPRLDCSKKNKKNLRFYKLDVSFDTTNSVARWILHSSAYSQESSILNTSHMWSWKHMTCRRIFECYVRSPSFWSLGFGGLGFRVHLIEAVCYARAPALNSP